MTTTSNGWGEGHDPDHPGTVAAVITRDGVRRTRPPGQTEPCRCVDGASHDVSPADPEQQRFALAAAAYSGSAEPAAASTKLVAQV